ncbi:hypothetical protein JYK02_14675 [Corallococcus macrosporus]|uniref:Uncharacterized protein n=1 Tax=Corallococcus macrosporus TaxID=35 RepID=A0ABS3DCI3_9BACT|nr:hypothetical protein [Corallococcus macrosporus]MBN8228750.1 hypothetical protein [Corallococcus macrosporus]
MSVSLRVVVPVVLLMTGVFACGAPPAPAPLHTDGVNLVLGDASFQARFGRLPTAQDDEDLRIRVHLEYVLTLLRQRRTDGLSASVLAARTRQLERLEAYVRAGRFPRNDGHPDARRPTFIDSRGRICAVGYLLEQDLGRSAAEAIAAGYKYAFIREMNSPLLARWAATTGLTREELELIQPSYTDDREDEYGPRFSMLEHAEGRRESSVASSLLFDGKGDGIPVRLDVSFADFSYLLFSRSPETRLGWYADVSGTKNMGGARSASALSNLDVGLFWTRSTGGAHEGTRTRFVLKGGLVLPTGDEDEVGASLNESVAAQRPVQAVLFQPGALGGRLGASLLGRLFCIRCSFRLDAGVDGYHSFGRGFQLSPRWGAGVAYSLTGFNATLEVAGTRYRERASRSRFHHSAAASLRYIPDPVHVNSPPFAFQPGVSITVPLEGRVARAFVGADLTWRL